VCGWPQVLLCARAGAVGIISVRGRAEGHTGEIGAGRKRYTLSDFCSENRPI
jgi:hypothetical protein